MIYSQNPRPHGMTRCDELASVPERLFSDVVADFLARSGHGCTAGAVIRKARKASLREVERDIYVDFAGSYWIAVSKRERRPVGGDDSIESARRRLGLLASPEKAELDHLYSRARRLAQEIEHLGARTRGDRRIIIADAELAAMRAAELLDEALRTDQAARKIRL